MLKNIISSWSVIVVSTLVVFINYPLLIERLGREQYGIWLLIASFKGYLELLQMGFPSANARYLADYLATDQLEKANSVFATSACFFNLLTLLSLVVGFTCGDFILSFFTIPEIYQRPATIAFMICFVEAGSIFSFEAFAGIVHAKKEFYRRALVRNGGTLLRLLLFYLFVVNDAGILRVAVVVLGVSLLQTTGTVWIARTAEPRLRFRFANVSRDSFFTICSFSMLVVLLQFASRLPLYTTPMIIGGLVSMGAIVSFNAANNILTYLGEFVLGLAMTMIPYLTEKHARGESDDLDRIFLQLSRQLSLILLFATVMLFAFGGEFLALWLGPGMAKSCYPLLVALCCGQYFFLTQWGAAYPVFVGTSRLETISKIMVLMAVIRVGVTCIGAWLFGLFGVALAAAVSVTFTSYFVFRIICGVVAVETGTYLREVFLQPVLSVLPLVLLLFLFKQSGVAVDSWGMLICCCAAASLFHLLLTVCFFLHQEERNWLFTRLRRRSAAGN